MVNDGSTDNSEAICMEYCKRDTRFKYYFKPNGGLSSARNLGMNHLRGEYVCFVDSDDWVLPNFVLSFVKGIKDSDIIIGRYILDDKKINKRYIPYHKSNWEQTYSGKAKQKQIVEHLMYDGIKSEFEVKDTVMPVWKNMYRCDFLKKENLSFISEREVYAEDYIFNMAAYCAAKKISVIDAAEIIHVVNNESLSQRYRGNLFEMEKKAHEIARNILYKYYGESYAARLDLAIPNIVAYAVQKEANCDFKSALKNIKRICDDPFLSNITKRLTEYVILKKNKVIIQLVRHKKIIITVLFLKIIYLFEKPYRMVRMIVRK